MTIQAKLLVFLVAVTLCLLASYFDTHVLQQPYSERDQGTAALMD